MERYLAALRSERRQRGIGRERPLRTLYLGGGTPSIWPRAALEELIAEFSVEPSSEVTVEVNPGDADSGWFAGLAAAGVNRFSIGAQALDDRRLAWLGRRHGVSEVEKAVAFAKRAGAAVSVDIIYGTPGQTPKALRRELKQAVEVGAQHISAYELSIKDGSPLDGRLVVRERQEIEDDQRAALLWHTVGDTLAHVGWERYEVSSYCRPGFRSRHNQVYWRGEPYVGLGAGAHGFCRAGGHFVRYANPTDIGDYLDGAPRVSDPSRPVASTGRREQLSSEEHAVELVMLGLRFAGGVDLSRLDELLSPEQKVRWHAHFEKWVSGGDAARRGAFLLPTTRGMLYADGLAAELIA